MTELILLQEVDQVMESSYPQSVAVQLTSHDLQGDRMKKSPCSRARSSPHPQTALLQAHRLFSRIQRLIGVAEARTRTRAASTAGPPYETFNH